KNGVRQYYAAGTSFVHSMLLHQLLAAGSVEGMTQVLQRAMTEHAVDSGGKAFTEEDYRRWIIVDGRVIAGGRAGEEDKALATWERLSRLPGAPLNNEGDKFVVDGLDVLIKVAGSSNQAEIYNLMACTAPPPDFVMFTLYQFLKSFSVLWARANAL